MDGKPFQPGENVAILMSPRDDHDRFTPGTEGKPLSTERKAHLISKACHDGDVGTLVELATAPGGLIRDDLRKLGCERLSGFECDDAQTHLQTGPILLGSTAGKDKDPAPAGQDDWRNLPEHKSEQQVQMDVDRSFVYYPDGSASPIQALARICAKTGCRHAAQGLGEAKGPAL